MGSPQVTPISGGGTVTISGGGTVTLSGSNSYSGQEDHQRPGGLAIGSAGALKATAVP